MGDRREVIIIGGGVIGLACAHYLIESGARVTVVDKGEVGQGASHGNCGLLYFSDVIPLCSPGAVSTEVIRALKGTSPLYIKPELDIDKYLWLTKFALKCRPSWMNTAAKAKYELLTYSMTLFKSFFETSGLPCDFEDIGILSVFKEKQHFEAQAQTQAFQKKFGLEAEPINRERLSALEPALLDDVAGAWLNKADWHLRPELLMTAWHNLLTEKGVVFHEGCEVQDVAIQHRSVRQVYTTQGEFEADSVVLAAGAWTPLLAKKLGLNLPVVPGKGYSLTMARPEICPTYPLMLYEKNMVATPWKSAYRLGGTMEFSGYSHSLNKKRINKLITGATAYLRTPLGEPLIEEWTNLRPMTYDDMPIIDRPHHLKNLIIATGHGMLGLTLCTGTGKAVCDMLLEQNPQIDMTPYALTRF
ncbi:MAG: amino acid dehydrogenase [Desulfobacterales bacterium]|nr:MAG: amino acid dehydrogenase [Desulfobacterales bacterium]